MSETSRLLLFDVDGTLVLSGGAGARSVDEAFARLFGVAGAMARCQPHGKTDPAIFQEVARTHLGRTLTPAESDAIAEAYLNALAREVPASPGYEVMPGVSALLEALAADPRMVLGLATGNLEEGARIKLARAGLDRFFAFGGYGSDDEDRVRLVRIAVARGARRAGRSFPPEAIVVIGDTGRDIAAARGAGVRCVAVATGPSSAEELARHAPDALLPDLSDIDAFLSQVV
jgi:phosphoglycolate phosphatase